MAQPHTQTPVKIDADIVELLRTVEQNAPGFQLILFNDDHHDMLEVTIQLRKAVGCSVEQATKIMLQAHTNGEAVALEASEQRCLQAAAVLRQIELGCEVRKTA